MHSSTYRAVQIGLLNAHYRQWPEWRRPKFSFFAGGGEEGRKNGRAMLGGEEVWGRVCPLQCERTGLASGKLLKLYLQISTFWYFLDIPKEHTICRRRKILQYCRPSFSGITFSAPPSRPSIFIGGLTVLPRGRPPGSTCMLTVLYSIGLMYLCRCSYR